MKFSFIFLIFLLNFSLISNTTINLLQNWQSEYKESNFKKSSEIYMLIVLNDLNQDLKNGWLVWENKETRVLLIGNQMLSDHDRISFTSMLPNFDHSCHPSINDTYELEIIEKNQDFTLAQTIIKLPTISKHMQDPAYSINHYFLCLKHINKSIFTYQGDLSLKSTQIEIFQQYLPVWSQILISLFSLGFSFYLSGLALGIMSLDITDLLILIKEGNQQQKKYAELLLPIRKNGNRILCTILLSNVAANALVTIFFNRLLDSGWKTFILSTTTLCIIGEV